MEASSAGQGHVVATNRAVSFTAALAAVALVAAGCGGSSSSAIQGAGSTLVAPLLAQWSSTYEQKSGVSLTYTGIGSGGGILQITERTVDFGASDAPLTPSQASACHGCVQIPWALAATLVSYNLKGVSGHLKLTGPVLANIFLGKITNWDDPAIAKLNPGATLPSEKIATVHRSDGSGDTYAFTDYLAHVSPAWKQKVGVNASVSWPNGTGGKGNSGVAALIGSTPGAIGYVAIGQVMSAHMTYALVENSAGRFPVASQATIAAAASTAHFASDNSASIVDPPASAANAYPISTFTYVIVPKSSSKIASLKKFLRWAVSPSAQAQGRPFAFAPLPSAVRSRDLQAIGSL
ncbi:MAG: phosphate ABC transporter substrate-binding protein PstS [Gaiellaceae bacterium]